MRTITLLFIPGMLLTGCIQDLLEQGAALAPDTEMLTSAPSTGEPPTPTSSDGETQHPGVQTVTGDEHTTGTTSEDADPGTSSSSSGEAPANLPPTIELFAASPKHLSEAGPAELQLFASDDVVKVRLSLDGELLATLTPADFPYVWEALSAKDNGPARKFEVVVENAEGLTAAATTSLGVLLPPAGAEKCIFEDKGANASAIAALKYTKDAILAVGSRDTGAGLRLTLWKLDPDTCQPFSGWPKTIINWTAQPALAAMTSFGAAVDLNLDGNIVVAGNFFVGGKTQSYVALLNPAGSRLWEKEGKPGDEVTGVAAARDQFKNRVFAVGSRRTSDAPVRTDGAIWTYTASDGGLSAGPPTLLQAPFTPEEFELDEKNQRSEWIRAVVIHPTTGNALVVGEREFSPAPNKVYSRAFTAIVHPLAGVVGTPRTSEANASPVHDAARSVAICGDGFLTGGWARDWPVDAKPQPMMFWLAADGSFIQHRAEPLSSAQTHGIACDREDKIISAGTRSAGPTDAQVFTVTGPFGPRISYETGVAGDDGAGAVACDPRGFCGWGGFRTANGTPYAVVRVHHP